MDMSARTIDLHRSDRLPDGSGHLSELFTLPRVRRFAGTAPARLASALEARARREYGSGCRRAWRRPAHVPTRSRRAGRLNPVPMTISSTTRPPYDCYGLPPADYPRVYAEPGAPSPHRMPSDNALCLWYPLDPAERRWTADKGLLDLLDIITSHLLYEAYWRVTGGVPAAFGPEMKQRTVSLRRQRDDTAQFRPHPPPSSLASPGMKAPPSSPPSVRPRSPPLSR